MPAKQKVKVRLTWYVYVKRQYGPVTLGVLVPGRRHESEEVGSPVEVMLSVVESASRKSMGDYLEVEVEGQGIVERMGESPKYRAQRLLFPRPARLRKVGILDREALNKASKGLGYIVFDKTSMKWFSVEEEVYVYEGTITAPEDVIAVYLETDEGGRLVFNPAYERRLKDVLLPDQSSREYHGDEPGQGGDSSL